MAPDRTSSDDKSNHWSVRKLTNASGFSKATVYRILHEASVKPDKIDCRRESPDQEFVEKQAAMLGLYLGKGPLLLYLLLALCVFSVFWPGSHAAAFELGLHMDLTYNGNALQRAAAIHNAKALGAKVSRNSLLWYKIEAVHGIRDWTIPDSVVHELLDSGIEPLFCIYGTPSWANGVSPTTAGYYLYVPQNKAAFHKWLGEYKDFVTEAVKRYKGKVRKWELWNEENEHYFWKPKPNADLYFQWFKEIQAAIKAVDPSAEVALGGLAGLSASGPDDINGSQFLKIMYRKGIFPQIIAIHPYAGRNQPPDVTIKWENNFTDIESIYNIMKANGQAKKKIWITEWGWPTNEVTDSEQAQYVEKSLAMIRDLYPFVSLATYFLDYDRPPGYYQGLCRSDLTPKAAAWSFKDFASTNNKLQPPTGLKLQ